MIQSLKTSNLLLRLGIFALFIWFGMDKFIHPDYWLSAWVPKDIIGLLDSISVGQKEIVYFLGLFETLVALGMLANVWVKYISLVGVVYVLTISIMSGMGEATARNIPLIMSFGALILWPERRMY